MRGLPGAASNADALCREVMEGRVVLPGRIGPAGRNNGANIMPYLPGGGYWGLPAHLIALLRIRKNKGVALKGKMKSTSAGSIKINTNES